MQPLKQAELAGYNKAAASNAYLNLTEAERHKCTIKSRGVEQQKRYHLHIKRIEERAAIPLIDNAYNSYVKRSS